MGTYKPGTWLFLHQGSNRITDQLTGRICMPGHVLDALRSAYARRHDTLAAKGIPYVPVVVPEKQCVYPELVAASVAPVEERCVMQILRHIGAEAPFRPLYPVAALQEAKGPRPLYFAEDTHWTFAGAFVAYRALMRRAAQHVQCRTLDDDDVAFYEGAPRHALMRFDTYCPHDLAVKIDPDYMGPPSRVMIRNRRARMVEDNRVLYIGHKAVFEQDAPHLASALLVRDSYSDMMLPFLAESFRRLVVVWQPNMDWSLVEREKPDIVMSQQAERFLVAVPDQNGPTNAEWAARKLAAAAVAPADERCRPSV